MTEAVIASMTGGALIFAIGVLTGYRITLKVAAGVAKAVGKGEKGDPGPQGVSGPPGPAGYSAPHQEPVVTVPRNGYSAPYREPTIAIPRNKHEE